MRIPLMDWWIYLDPWYFLLSYGRLGRMSRFLPVCLFLSEFVCCLWDWHCLMLLAWFKIFCHSHCWFRLVPRISCWVMLGSNVWPFGLVTDYVRLKCMAIWISC